MSVLLQKINSSKKMVFAVLLGIYLIMLYCNYLTHLSGDDFVYMYSFAGGARIESIWDIFPSMYLHRFSMNGRVIPHFMVQLSLLLPLPIFKLINPLVFTVFIYTIYSFSHLVGKSDSVSGATASNSSSNALLLAVVFGCIWVLSPSFGTVFLWLDGSINYLWAECFSFIWLYTLASAFMTKDMKLSLPKEILFALFSFVIGNYSENSAVAMIAMELMFILLIVFYKREKLKRWHISSLVSAFIGFLFLALAPATISNKISVVALSEMFIRVGNLLAYYTGSYWPLLLFYVVSYAVSFKKRLSREVRLLSLVFLLGSLAALLVLCFAPYVDRRSYYISFALLLLSCVPMFVEICKTNFRPFAYFAGAVCLCMTLYWGYIGISDLRTVNYRFNYNEQLIREELANGAKELHVPFIIPKTQYSAFYPWGYVHIQPDHHVNGMRAYYYGVEKISGYYFYELNED